MTNRVGIIGLGNMGGAIAGNLVSAGFSVIGFDIDEAAVSRASERGVSIAKNVTSVVDQAEVVIISLASPGALKLVTEELATKNWDNRILVKTGTFKLADKMEAKSTLEQGNISLLDRPLSGTGHQARTGDLVVFTSGDEQAVKKCSEIFKGFSREEKYCGEFGNGIRMKYVANHLIAVHNVAAAEAMVFGMKAGLDPKLIFNTLEDSAGTSRMSQVRGPLMVKNNYDDVGATNTLFKKDLDVITDFASDINCSVPLFSIAAQPYRAIMDTDLVDKDTAAVCKLLEEMNGIKRQ
ncbi:NAD(P)-dependent oxidoreductase [Pseudomonadota bacterium]